MKYQFATVREALDNLDIPIRYKNLLSRCYYWSQFRRYTPDDSFDVFIKNLEKPFDHYNPLFHCRGIGPKLFEEIRSLFLEE